MVSEVAIPSAPAFGGYWVSLPVAGVAGVLSIFSVHSILADFMPAYYRLTNSYHQDSQPNIADVPHRNILAPSYGAAYTRAWVTNMPMYEHVAYMQQPRKAIVRARPIHTAVSQINVLLFTHRSCAIIVLIGAHARVNHPSSPHTGEQENAHPIF